MQARRRHGLDIHRVARHRYRRAIHAHNDPGVFIPSRRTAKADSANVMTTRNGVTVAPRYQGNADRSNVSNAANTFTVTPLASARSDTVRMTR